MGRALRCGVSFALLSVLLGSCAADPGPARARRPIINGEVDETHTAVVALVTLGSEFCSGTVIAPRAVLTAAHCVADGFDAAAILVFFGTTVGEAGPYRRVTAATYHPDFYSDEMGYVYNDVAVLTLEEDAPVKPMAWQRTPLEDPTGRTVTFVGYGVTDAQRQTGNDTRRTVTDVVGAMTPDYIHFTGNGVSGTCQGDSGGPTFLDQDGVLTVIAVTSIGIRGCVSESDNTRVDIHADFIAPLAPMPVTITVDEPAEGGLVGQRFAFSAAATAPAGVAEVALLLDGEPVTTFAEPPYTFTFTDVPDGDHLISVEATGADGGRGALDVWVTVTTQNLGVHCATDADCRSGLCADAAAGRGFCTQACTSDADCSADAACNPVAGGKLCGRPGSASGGCAVGGRRGGPGAGLLIVLTAVLLGGRAWRRRGLRRLAALGLGGVALTALLAACGDNLHRYDEDAGFPVRGTRPLNDAGPEPAPIDAAAPSGVGDACTSDSYLGQGDCAPGLICLTEQLTHGLATNGYCTVQCGEGLTCPADSACAAISAATSMCLLQCTGEAGCRADDGYHCMDADTARVCWTWQVPPGTNDGGACTPFDAGPFVNATGRVFGASRQLFAPDGGMLEAQPHVVARGTTVAATFTSYSGSYGGGRMAVSASQNGGASFGPSVVVQDTLTTRSSDPVLAVDASGAHLYLAWVGYDRSGGQITNMRVLVARSDDGGQTWPTAQIVDATTTDTGTGTVARPRIATGPGDTVYVTYSLGTGAASAIKLARSSDLGATWDAPVRVDDQTRPGSSRGLPAVATNAAGDVFVGWIEVGGLPGGDVANDVFVARWDAGTPWGTFGANVKGSADADLVVSNGLAVVPAATGAALYLVYVAGPPDSLRWDVRMAWSADRGDSFTAASIKINDDASCATHLLPAAAIDPLGRLHVAWYDNRFGDPAGAFFYSQWDPSVGTPSASELVSDATFAYSTDTRAINRLGNYAGLAVDGTSIYATWSDARGVTNSSHVRFAQGTLP